MPKVSIILPNFNHADFLPMRLQSLANQTFQDVEYIFIDDASTDDSVEILKSFQNQHDNVRLIEHQQNSGNPFLQWQIGSKLADGDYIWIAESDDVAKPDFLETLVSSLNEHSTAAMAACDSMAIDAEHQPQGKYSLENLEMIEDGIPVSGTTFIETNMSKYNSLPNVSAILFRKASMLNLDQDVVELSYIGDWLLYLKILTSRDMVYHTKTLNYFRTHAATTRSQESKNWQLLCQEFGKIYDYLKTHELPVKLNLDQIISNINYLDNLRDNIAEAMKAGSLKSLAIYGAGALGLYCQQQLSGLIAIDCFIDKKYLDYADGTMSDTPVLSLDQYRSKKSDAKILIASLAYYDDIILALSHAGLREQVINHTD